MAQQPWKKGVAYVWATEGWGLLSPTLPLSWEPRCSWWTFLSMVDVFLEKLSKPDLLMKQIIFSMPPGVYPGGEEILQRDLFFCKRSNHCQTAGDGQLHCPACSCPSPSSDFQSPRLDMGSPPGPVTQARSAGLLGSFPETFSSLMERTMQGRKHTPPPLSEIISGCAGSSLLHGLFSSCDEQGHTPAAVSGLLPSGFSCCRAQALRSTGFISCRSWALLGMWDPPRAGIERVSPALAGRLFTTEPPGKPQTGFLRHCWVKMWSQMCAVSSVTTRGAPEHWWCSGAGPTKPPRAVSACLFTWSSLSRPRRVGHFIIHTGKHITASCSVLTGQDSLENSSHPSRLRREAHSTPCPGVTPSLASCANMSFASWHDQPCVVPRAKWKVGGAPCSQTINNF